MGLAAQSLAEINGVASLLTNMESRGEFTFYCPERACSDNPTLWVCTVYRILELNSYLPSLVKSHHEKQ
jgi:hypothetical protein